jgi:hypothetical protein
MNVTPITSSDRIFQVFDIVPTELLAQIENLNWADMSWQRVALQETWPRRLIIDQHQYPVLQQVDSYIWENISLIEEICKVTFANKFPSTSWWYDEPDFDVKLHTDGHLPASMQLFWIAPGKEFATQFYKFKDLTTAITNFEFIPNLGYIMLNQPAEDGSQPLHWHAMVNKLPKNTFRVTSYTTFGTYENK